MITVFKLDHSLDSFVNFNCTYFCHDHNKELFFDFLKCGIFLLFSTRKYASLFTYSMRHNLSLKLNAVIIDLADSRPPIVLRNDLFRVVLECMMVF
jgi:hypothetical protein